MMHYFDINVIPGDEENVYLLLRGLLFKEIQYVSNKTLARCYAHSKYKCDYIRDQFLREFN